MLELDPLILSTTPPSALDALMSAAPNEPAWLRDSADNHPVMRLEGPSTLVLALIGAATLLAYQKISDRLAPAAQLAVRTHQRHKSKSTRRRRAA